MIDPEVLVLVTAVKDLQSRVAVLEKLTVQLRSQRDEGYARLATVRHVLTEDREKTVTEFVAWGPARVLQRILNAVGSAP